MCVLCFNSQWRSVLIGTASATTAMTLILLTVGFKDEIGGHFDKKLRSEKCLAAEEDDYEFEEYTTLPNTTSAADGSSSQTLSRRRDCVYLIYSALFPWPLWCSLGIYFVISAGLVVSALYKSLPGITAFLTVDAIYVGFLSAAVCLSFFPADKITRLILMTASMPSFAMALLSWTTVFEFYLQLDQRERRREKRRMAARHD